MRIPDPGPLGETRFEARDHAMVTALLVNNPFRWESRHGLNIGEPLFSSFCAALCELTPLSSW
jgi:hypothetical protein